MKNTNQISYRTFSVLMLCLFVSLSVMSQINSKKVIEEREGAKDRYLEAKSNLKLDSSKVNFRNLVNQAENLFAKDQYVIAAYTAANDTLVSMSARLSVLSKKSVGFEKELSKKTTYMILFLSLGSGVTILTIVFMYLFVSRNSKLKKVMKDFEEFGEREIVFNDKIEELQRDLEKIKVDAETRIYETEANFKNEISQLKSSEVELINMNNQLRNQLSEFKGEQNNSDSKINELKKELEKEQFAKSELEMKLKKLADIPVDNTLLNDLHAKLANEQKLREALEQKLNNTEQNNTEKIVSDNTINELIMKNESLHSETRLLMEKLTREVQLKQQLETQVMELKDLIHQHDELHSTVLNVPETEETTKAKQELVNYVEQLEAKLQDEINARTLLETEFHNILKELGGDL